MSDGQRPLWQAAPRHAAAIIVATIVGGLALEAAFGWPGQLAADAWAVGAFGWLFIHGGAAERLALLLCLLIAGAGEAVLSLAWGLYDYRFHNIPLFVPPGHALLMTLGVLTARRLPRKAVWLVPLAALPWAATGWAQGWDTAGAALFAVFAACVAACATRRLYASMFVLSLAMELYGTWLGSWAWHQHVPLLPLTTTNPPLAAGAFYCMLDLLALAVAARLGRPLPALSLTRN